MNANVINYLVASLLLGNDNILDDITRRINDKRNKPGIKGDEKLVVGVNRIGKATHLNVDIVDTFTGKHFNQDAMDAVLLAGIVVLRYEGFHVLFFRRESVLVAEGERFDRWPVAQ